ncbi:MAG TPA: AtpZ/AtpI family protein [Syntrophales bacterium]|nr:AtpZ/AtpI family protein [Syntrophales bacterium]HQM30244.1 AtpZ/AtpI family protein [Syntrophales bacterium]
MPVEKPKANPEQTITTGSILMLSAWGLAMVLSSFLFLYIGFLVDEILGTTPKFMLGSFLLAIGLCVWRLYKEAKQKGLRL